MVSTGENRATLEIRGNTASTGRRASDRVVPFSVEVTFKDDHVERSNSLGFAAGQYVHTIIGVSIRPLRDRDRRRENAAERARLLLHSLRSYLMAKELDADNESSVAAVAEE